MNFTELTVCNRQLWTHDRKQTVELVADCNTEQRAKQIALAWNLLSATERVLKMAVSDYERDNPTISANPHLGCEWYKEARFILAKADCID